MMARIMPERYKVVFFDLDDTLTDNSAEGFLASVWRTCEQFGGRNGMPRAEHLKDAYLSSNLEQYRDAAGANDERPLQWIEIDTAVWARSLAACGFSPTDEAVAMAEMMMREWLERLKLFDDVLDTLKLLSTRYTLGLISNGQGDLQRAKLSTLGLDAYLPIVLISGEVGTGKPNVGIFGEAARRARVRPDEAVHIGNSLTSDVAGAKAAGMLAIWLNRGGAIPQLHEPRPDHQVASLSEVSNLLS